MKKLKDIIKKFNLKQIRIMYRTNSPLSVEEDMLLGYCQYDKGELISLDGDSYSLEDKIVRYEMDKDINGLNFLIVWVQSEWL